MLGLKSNEVLREELTTKKTEELSPISRKIISVSRTTPLSQIVKLLRECDIHCVPVIEKTEIYGMIDVLDIAIYLAELCDNEGTLDLKYLFEIGDVEAEKFINLSGRNEIVPITSNSPLSALVTLLAQSHRVLVVNTSDGLVRDLISQLKCLNSLYVEGTFEFFKQELSTLDLLNKQLITISFNEPVISALRLLRKHKVYAVAVVDQDGRLWGTFSSTECKYLNTDYFASLNMQLKEFISIKEGWPVSVLSSAKLGEVVEKMLADHIYRVFVTDENYVATGVVTCTDIFQCLARLVNQETPIS